MTQRVLNRNEVGYRNLVKVAKIMETVSPNHMKYCVEETYLDFGQNWMWTTIVRYGGWTSCQVLSPKDWGDIVSAKNTYELLALTLDIMQGKWFGDKVKVETEEDRFLEAYNEFTRVEYHNDPVDEVENMMGILFTTFDDEDGNEVGYIQISIDTKRYAYIVEWHFYNGEVYTAEEKHGCLDSITDELYETNYDGLYDWGMDLMRRTTNMWDY